MASYRNKLQLHFLTFVAFIGLTAAMQACATTRPHHGCGCGMEERMGR